MGREGGGGSLLGKRSFFLHRVMVLGNCSFYLKVKTQANQSEWRPQYLPTHTPPPILEIIGGWYLYLPVSTLRLLSMFV